MATNQKRSAKKYILLTIIVIALIFVAAFSYTVLSHSLLGAPKNPYNPSLGYQGAGYYKINGQSKYLSSAYQLNNITNVSNNSSTVTTSIYTSTIVTSSTIPPSTTLNTTTINTTTTTSSSTTGSTSTVHVGGGQCVFGCGTPSLRQTGWGISNGVVDVGQYETLDSAVLGNQPPFSYNDLVYDSTGSLDANQFVTGISSSSNAFSFQITGAFATGSATANTVVKDSGKLATSDSLTFTINPEITTPAINTPPVVDTGQLETLTATWSGGTSPYIVDFSVYNSVTNNLITNNLVTESSTSNAISFTALTGNTYVANLIVTDSATTPVSVNSPQTSIINVGSQLSGNAVTTSNVLANQVFYETLNGIWSGGTAPYTVNFFITNSVNGNIITNSIYTVASGTSNTFTFLVPRTNDALGTEDISFKVSDSASTNEVATESNTITVQAGLPIEYSYNGASTNAGSSISILFPASSVYFCGSTGWIGSLGTSYTQDISPDLWTAIGHQTSSSTCSVTQANTGAFTIAGVGVTNAVVYNTIAGSNDSSGSSYTFKYNVSYPAQDTFILVSQVTSTLSSMSVSPTSGTCTQVENEDTVTSPTYSALLICTGQSANTYTVTVNLGQSPVDPAGYVVYSVK
jgi:hypothetical protein